MVDSSGQTATHITSWGWQAGILSVVPLLMWGSAPVANVEMSFLVFTVTPSNVCFVAAAILLPLRRRRAALACALISLASMIYSGLFLVPAHQSELVRTPAGHFGPGYYVWVIAGMLMVWTAFSSRSAH